MCLTVRGDIFRKAQPTEGKIAVTSRIYDSCVWLSKVGSKVDKSNRALFKIAAYADRFGK
ncbi:hypothetical protein D9O36_05980 [Zobellia amurskyensis]|uniref:Uncharacterized protein n=1 Tax=Zobellia amurskyensis TaxID=248905 RepID=A0A7X2ZS35_9FLAO|nr:hypothetical protein [Zobellia amurskyensis]